MNYNVPPDYNILSAKKSTTKTLNGYAKKEVMETLIDVLEKGLTIDANYWAAELFSSGLYLPLWDCILRFYFRSVHYCNPHLVDYINQKYALLCRIKKIYSGNLKNLCNNQELRNHFAEIITILCSVSKETLVIAIKGQVNPIPDDLSIKINHIIQLIMPSLSSQSSLHTYFHAFIVSYYSQFEVCSYYLNWFVRDNEHTINEFSEFSVPTSMSHKSVWLIWKFILLQCRHCKKEYMELIEILINFYIMIYRRKDYDTCVYLLLFALTLTRYPQKFQWSARLDLLDVSIIKHCAEINLIYQNLQNSYTAQTHQGATVTKDTRKSKKQKEKDKFYTNVKNQDFLKTINSSDILLSKSSSNGRTPKPPQSAFKHQSVDDLIVSVGQTKN